MTKAQEIHCPLCKTLMVQNMSKTMAHFRQHANTVGVYVCPKCECERTITIDDNDDDY